jgi:DNA-binding MarR family transcriptional regulator
MRTAAVKTAAIKSSLQNQSSSQNHGSLRDHGSLRLWLRLLSSTHLIEQEIRSRLRQEFDSTLPRFDLMSQLERQPKGLRMGELSKRMLVTSGNVTAIVDQLESEALVTRKACDDDRRAFLIAFTEKGRKAFQIMAKAHEAWVEELFAGLKNNDKKTLHELLGQLKTHALKLHSLEEAEHFARTRHKPSQHSEPVSRRAA